MRHAIITIGIAALACLALPASGAATEDTQSTASALQAVLEELNALDEWFDEAERRLVELQNELKGRDEAIAENRQALESLSKEQRATEAEIATLDEQRIDLAAQRHRQAQRIAEHLVAAYRASGGDFLKQLLNQESPDEMDRLVRYHRYFSEARLEQVREFRATLVALQENATALDAQQEQLSEQAAQLGAEGDRLANARGDRATLIADLDSERQSKQAHYRELQADRDRLETLLAELRRRATTLDGTTFERAKGDLPMPVTGRVLNAFGTGRAEGRLTWHGINIAAPPGQAVAAVHRGRVVFSDWLRGFGLLTVLDHGSGYMTLYGHADRLLKSVGDMVEGGEPIAEAGNSGGNGDSGIYFEIRKAGEVLDPIVWLNR